MKHLLLSSLIFSTLVFGFESKEEVALVMKNEDRYSEDDLKTLTKNYLHFSQKLLDKYTHTTGELLQQTKEEILQGIVDITKQNTEEFKSLFSRGEPPTQEIFSKISTLLKQNKKEINKTLASFSKQSEKQWKNNLAASTASNQEMLQKMAILFQQNREETLRGLAEIVTTKTEEPFKDVVFSPEPNFLSKNESPPPSSCSTTPSCSPKPPCSAKPCCPPKPPCSAKPCCPPTEPPAQLTPGYTAPASFCHPCNDLWGGVSFIYWQAQPENFIMATSNTLPLNSGGNPPTDVSIIYLDCPFTPGLKASIGWGTPHDSWMLGAEYTLLAGSSSQSLTAPPGGLIAPHWTNGVNQTVGASMNTNWRYTFNIADVKVARSGHFGKNLIFTPHFGGRFFSNHQKLTVNNTYLRSGVPFFLPTTTKADAWELGPRMGFDSTWLLGSGMEFIGNIAFSILYTQFASYHREKGSIDLNQTSPISYQNNFYQTFSPNLDIATGLGWGMCVNCNRQRIYFAAKYELLIFWGNNQLPSQLNGSDLQQSSTLFLDGVTVSGRFDF